MWTMGGTDIGAQTQGMAGQVARARLLLADGNWQDAEILLRGAAAAGNCDAMLELGQHLFLGRPPIPDAILQEAVNLITQGARAGHAGAAHLAALIAANDPSAADHWNDALDYLTQSAVAGHRLAQFELAFLAGDRNIAALLGAGERIAPDTWKMLRNAVDISALTAAPAARIISETPRIVMVDEFITPAMCDWIMRRAKPALKRARGYNPQGDGPIQRTNSEVEYPFPELDFVHMAVRQRISNVTGLSQLGMEPPSVFRYMPGQEFTGHFDFLDPDRLAEEIARTGQCVATALIYLSTDFDGGETEFSKIGLRIKGMNRGDALIFRNVDMAGVPDLKTFHAGLPPTRGEKWLFSQFVRNTKQANKLPGA